MTTQTAIHRGVKRFDLFFIRRFTIYDLRIYDLLFNFQIDDFDTGSLQQVDAICQTVLLTIYHPLDTRLDDEFGTLNTGRGRDIDGGTVAVIIRTGEFRNGIGLGMEHVRLRHIVLILADILKTCGRSVVAVADDHLILDHQSTHLTARAVGVLCPNTRHSQIAFI